MSDIKEDLQAAALDLDVDVPEGYAEEPVDEDLPTEEAESSDVSEASEALPEDEQPAPEDDEEPQPAAWAAEMRQHWKSLPKDVRKYIGERERQQHAYISRFGSEHGKLKKEAGEIEAAFKPFEQAISTAGVSKSEVIKQLITERSEMMRDPETFIKRFADHHKLDLVKLAVDTDWKEPPETRKARWEMQDKQRELEAQRSELQQRQQEVETRQLTEFIEGWGAQKPHFQHVRQAMAQVLPEIQQSYPYLDFQQQLETTYEAVLRHPSFASLTKPRNVPHSVRRAASGVSGLSGAPTPAPEPGSLREALMQAAKETGYF